MNVTGWEIKPLGWFVIAIVIGLTVYFLVSLRKPKKEETTRI